MYYYMYRITNWFNGKVYVGVHRTDNLDDGYMGSGTLVRAAIQKYGIEYFTRDILQFFDTPEAMFDAEAEVVDQDFIKSIETYNIRLGGNGGFGHMTSAQQREAGKKGWASFKGKMMKDGAFHTFCVKGGKAAGKTSFKGKSHSEETKAKMRESAKGKHEGINNSQYGTCWIHSLELKVSKKIPKGELDTYRKQGWIRGRKQNFS